MSEAGNRSPVPSARTSFFDVQKRQRRTARLLTLVCLFIVSGIGLVLSTVVTPLLLLAVGGLLHLLARFGIFPDALRRAAHGLGGWAAGHSTHFQDLIASFDHVAHVSDLGVTITPLLRLAPFSFPALAAAGLVWILLRRLSLRGNGRDLILRLGGRAPNLADLEERQLANIIAEMAIAAGVPAPTVYLLDTPDINAAAIGASHAQASVLVTRGLLNQLDREETSGIVAHLVASVGAGDMRLMAGILAVFQTFGFFVTFLDLPTRWSAWKALGRLSLAAGGVRRDPMVLEQTLEQLERGVDADSMPDLDRVWSIIPSERIRKVLLAPLLPLILISMFLRLILFLWTALFLGPSLAMIWRTRRYAADAMAVQLTRDPDGLARALSRIGGSAIPTGGEGREYCFVHGPPVPERRGFTARSSITRSLHPRLGRRLLRLHRLGATAGGGEPRAHVRLDMIAQHPGRALLAGFLLLLLLPLGAALILMVGYLTAIVMTVGLAAGLAIVTGVLG